MLKNVVASYIVGDDGDFYPIALQADGTLLLHGDEPYEDCDFGGLCGLVCFEGELIGPEEWKRRHDVPGDPFQGREPDPDITEFWEGAWRKMTAAEAVQLGLVAKGEG